MGNIEIKDQWRFYTYAWPWLTEGDGLDFTKSTIRLVVGNDEQDWTVLRTEWSQSVRENVLLTLQDTVSGRELQLRLWVTPLRKMTHKFIDPGSPAPPR